MADIVFLVDASDRITELEFQQQKAFFYDISRQLNVSPYGTRAGFITYSDNPYFAITFDSYNKTADFYSQLSRLKVCIYDYFIKTTVIAYPKSSSKKLRATHELLVFTDKVD